MPVTYDPDDLPDGRRAPEDEVEPYLDALRRGRGVGDGVGYPTRDDARRAMARIKARVEYRAPRAGLARPATRIWEAADGDWLWALLPGRARPAAGDEAAAERAIIDRHVRNARADEER